MTLRPTGAAAAIVLGLALSPLVGVVPVAAETSPGLPTEVALVVPLTVPASTTGLIPVELLTEYTSETGILTRALDQVGGRPVTLAIDPMIIASIRVLGTEAPESAVLWLDRLATLSNDSFALSWADSDLTLGVNAGSTVVLAPESLDFAIDPARFGPAEIEPTGQPSPSATPSADPDDPSLPTTESLLDWNYTLTSVAWPAADSVSAETLRALADAYDISLLASSNVSGLSSLTSTASIGDTAALISNAELSAAFSASVDSFTSTEWELETAKLTAQAAAAASQSGASSAVVTLDRAIGASDPDLGATISALEAIPEVQLVGLSAVADNAAPSASIVDKSQDADAIESIASLLRLEGTDASFAQIADDPSRVTSSRRLNLLATLSNSWAAEPDGRTGAIATYRAESAELRGAVKIVKSSSITLWADRGSLPVIVENLLDQPVTVYITVRPLTPLITVDDTRFELVVGPGSQSKAQVPVQSISNGVVELEISLHGAASQQIGNTTYVSTNVQAGWETPFTIGVGVLVVLVFVAGIVRTILRLRRARANRITIA